MTELFERSAPGTADIHLVDSGIGWHLFIPNGSRLYDLDEQTWRQLAALQQAGALDELDQRLGELGVDAPPYVDDQPLVDPPIRALSLAVAQKCNLGCAYCYAEGGSFGGAAVDMSEETALAAVDLLLGDVGAGDRVNLAFLGGEPLLNRSVLRAATEHAARLGAQRGAQVTFSVTTNGTQLTESDGDFFETHGFAVTVSVDGIGPVHDRLRPFSAGRAVSTESSPGYGHC